jgi:hypothetical protein
MDEEKLSPPKELNSVGAADGEAPGVRPHSRAPFGRDPVIPVCFSQIVLQSALKYIYLKIY